MTSYMNASISSNDVANTCISDPEFFSSVISDMSYSLYGEDNYRRYATKIFEYVSEDDDNLNDAILFFKTIAHQLEFTKEES